MTLVVSKCYKLRLNSAGLQISAVIYRDSACYFLQMWGDDFSEYFSIALIILITWLLNAFKMYLQSIICHNEDIHLNSSAEKIVNIPNV